MDIPIRLQEQAETCVPACLRMVFAAYGIHRSEQDITLCCQTDVDGTLPSLAVQCARISGFEAYAQRLDGVESLNQFMDDDRHYPIVYVNLSPILGIPVIHAVIIEAIDFEAGSVSVIDPANAPLGRRKWSMSLFELGWRMARYQTILIKHH